MQLRGLLASFLLTSLVLAGCAGTGPGAGKDEVEQGLEDLDLKATQTTGVIRGVVVDEAITPLAGATVNVLFGNVNRTAVTNEQGLFGLDGLEPGEYFLAASKVGYNSAQTSVTVVAGEDSPKTTKILLTIDPSLRPYFAAYQYDAFIGCSVTSPTVSAAACDVGPIKAATNNQFLVEYEPDAPPMWIQSEAIWDSSQPAGDDLSLSLTDFSNGPQRTVTAAAGKSPIFFTVNETVAQQYGYGTNNTLTIRVFSTTVEGTDQVNEPVFQDPYRNTVYGPLNSTGAPAAYQDVVVDNDPSGLLVNPFGSEECLKDAVLFNTCFDLGGVGIVVNQRVTVFTHIFYGYAPPEGWRFSEANSVPEPA